MRPGKLFLAFHRFPRARLHYAEPHGEQDNHEPGSHDQLPGFIAYMLTKSFARDAIPWPR
jgi:hypothetical protein